MSATAYRFRFTDGTAEFASTSSIAKELLSVALEALLCNKALAAERISFWTFARRGAAIDIRATDGDKGNGEVVLFEESLASQEAIPDGFDRIWIAQDDMSGTQFVLMLPEEY